MVLLDPNHHHRWGQASEAVKIVLVWAAGLHVCCDAQMVSTTRTQTDPLIVTAVLAVIAIGLSTWLYRSAFNDQFRCNYLIVDGVDAPQFMCDGADIGGATGVAGAVDSVADALGLGGDEPVVGDALSVPGLSGLINGPLDVVRRIGVVVGLLLLAATAALLTWINRNLRRLLRLLRFDPEAWRQAAFTGRTFFSIYLVLLMPVVILAITV